MAKNLAKGAYLEALDQQVDEERRLTNRARVILDACEKLAGLEAERRAVSEQIAEVKQKLVKGDLGMKLADFNVAFRYYKLEDERRDEFVEALKECFRALGKNETANFLDALERAQAAGSA